MRSITSCILCLMLSLNALAQGDGQPSQKVTKHPWFVLYASAAKHPPDVTIGNGKMGWGWGFTYLWSINSSIPSYRAPFWLGFDFNQHYFGTVTVYPYRVHYENWQMSMVGRFTTTTSAGIKPFIDVQLGARYLVSLTTYNREYSGIVVLRTEDFFATLLNLPANSGDSYRIEKEYGKMTFEGGFSTGILFPAGKTGFGGITLKASILFGGQTRYADRNQIKTVDDVYNYPLKNGSGFMYSFQLGISL